jgi:hypothetical protein
MHVIKKLRQEDCLRESEVSLVYKVNLRTAWATKIDSVLRKRKNSRENFMKKERFDVITNQQFSRSERTKENTGISGRSP